MQAFQKRDYDNRPDKTEITRPMVQRLSESGARHLPNEGRQDASEAPPEALNNGSRIIQNTAFHIMGLINWQPKDLYWQANHGDYELFANDGAYKTTHKGAIISDGTECEHLSLHRFMLCFGEMKLGKKRLVYAYKTHTVKYR